MNVVKFYGRLFSLPHTNILLDDHIKYYVNNIDCQNMNIYRVKVKFRLKYLLLYYSIVLKNHFQNHFEDLPCKLPGCHISIRICIYLNLYPETNDKKKSDFFIYKLMVRCGNWAVMLNPEWNASEMCMIACDPLTQCQNNGSAKSRFLL